MNNTELNYYHKKVRIQMILTFSFYLLNPNSSRNVFEFFRSMNGIIGGTPKFW